MSEQYKCNQCGCIVEIAGVWVCDVCKDGIMERLRWTKGGDGSHWEGCEDVHWDCRIAQLEKEIDRRDEQIAELTATTHSQAVRNAELLRFVWWVYQVYARNVQELTSGITEACTYETEEKAEKGKYGLPIRCWEYIRYLEEYTAGIYNGTYLDSETSTGVKRDLSDAEIEELGAQEAERKEFCPNCEAETPCTHEAELYVCDICGEDFAKYIVSRNCNVSDVSMTRDVSTDVKTGKSVEIEELETVVEYLQIRLSEWRGVAMLLVDELNEAKSKQLPTSWEDASVASPAYIAYRNLVDVEDDETNLDYYKGVQNDK